MLHSRLHTGFSQSEYIYGKNIQIGLWLSLKNGKSYTPGFAPHCHYPTSGKKIGLAFYLFPELEPSMGRIVQKGWKKERTKSLIPFRFDIFFFLVKIHCSSGPTMLPSVPIDKKCKALSAPAPLYHSSLPQLTLSCTVYLSSIHGSNASTPDIPTCSYLGISFSSFSDN